MGIGISNVDPSAVLHVESPAWNKGLLVPRVENLNSVSVTSNSRGVIVYLTDRNRVTDNDGYYYYYYDGSEWLRLVTMRQAETISQNAVQEYGVVNQGNTEQYSRLNMKVFDIGAWNMDNSSFHWVDITSNLGVANADNLRKIRFVQVLIIEDDQS